MSANNPVFQILVAPNNATPVTTAGQTLTQLVAGGIGTMGVFSYDTKLSVSSATAGAEREIFIAMAVDTDGDGVADDIVTSAGTHIQKKGLTAYSLKCFSAEAPHIVDITDFSGIKCESDYAFKIEFRGNSQAYQNFGFNQFAKTFAVKTGCCGPDCDCPSGDCNELAQLLVAAVNADTDGIVTAQLIDYTTTPGVPAVVLPANVAAWVLANAGLCLGVRLTSVASKVSTYCQIPAKYYKNVQFKMIVSTLQGLDCNAAVATFQEPSFGEGQGKDIGWLEYEAGGYKGKPGPYRVGELAGIPIGEFERLSTNAGIYNQVNLMYRNESVAGWEEHKNYINTIIAVPCANGANTILTGILPILDAFAVNQFDALLGDLAACTCSTTVPNLTSASASQALDGLG